jgi:hypothetical protein
MTKRLKLICKLIKHNQKEICNWPDLSANKLELKVKAIEKLQRRAFKTTIK